MSQVGQVGDRRAKDRRKLTSGTTGAPTEREMDPFPSMEKDPTMIKGQNCQKEGGGNNNQPKQQTLTSKKKEEREKERERGGGERQRSGRHRGCFFVVVFLLFLIVLMWMVKSIFMMYFPHGNRYKNYIVTNSYQILG